MTRASRRLVFWAGLTMIGMLSLLGVVHASWTDQVSLSATVSTGSIESAWFFASCDDNQPGSHEVAEWGVTPDPSDPARSLLITVDQGYATYQLSCDLHLANTGALPVTVASASAVNSNSGAATVTVTKSDGDKTLQPCGSTPSWGTQPNNVSAHCRQEIQMTLEIGENVQPGDQLQFAVQVEVELAT